MAKRTSLPAARRIPSKGMRHRRDGHQQGERTDERTETFEAKELAGNREIEQA
jgi:hypothetical protein